jgi:pimeloyl-ACP methyl ester carboxylesterase
VNKLVLSFLGYRPEVGEGISFKDPPNFTSRVEIKSDGSHLNEWWRRAALWGDPPEIVEERVIEYIKAGSKGEEIHWAADDYNSKLRLPLINCPTLVLTGTRDPFYSVSVNVKRLVPKSNLTIIENGPISVERVMPKEFAEAILSFLNTPAV